MAKDPTGAERYRRWYFLHQEEANEARRALYLSRKKDGLCPRCGLETKTGQLCDTCLEKARRWNSKKKEVATT